MLELAMNKIVFSGIQPSGDLHIGNYIGAVRQWVLGQSDGLNIFCVVDMHAITVPQDPQILKRKTREIAAIILAAGVDPDKSLLFVQSHNPDHANLGWVLNCFISMGQLSRMTQYKEKSEHKEFVSVGLFDYPALMAADILLYNTTEVPVGEDQKQHVELARDAATRFNSRFGDTFLLPKPVIPKSGGRVMSLVDPTKKMSKSDSNAASRIGLLDSADQIRAKVLSATTDSGTEIKHSPDKPGISNLIDIYAHMKDKSITEVESVFMGKSYKEFKQEVAQSVIDFLDPFQARYRDLIESTKLDEVLQQGATRAHEISSTKLSEVYDKIGFIKH